MLVTRNTYQFYAPSAINRLQEDQYLALPFHLLDGFILIDANILELKVQIGQEAIPAYFDTRT